MCLRLVCGFTVWASGVLLGNCNCQAESSIKKRHSLRSEYFLIQTDLDTQRARAVLKRMDDTLRVASRYWGRPVRGLVNGYIVDDLANWSVDCFPAKSAYVVLQKIGGGTVPDVALRNGRKRIQTTIYAMSRPGIAEHEVVHAYCYQAFGRAGPVWYREGMAELFSEGVSTTPEVRCRVETLELLRAAKGIDVKRIVSATDFTRQISAAVLRLTGDRAADRLDFDATEAWRLGDDQAVKRSRLPYAQSWALCHFMNSHPKYRGRFRKLGRAYLAGRRISFDDVFGQEGREIEFEFGQFLRNLDLGYRVDLCSWDWRPSSSRLTVGRSEKTVVRAASGFQPTNLSVVAGQQFKIETNGRWTVDGQQQVAANGNEHGLGTIEAVVMRDYSLTESIELIPNESLTVSSSGDLFLRCNDHWNALANNSGTITVRIRRTR